MMKSKTTSRRPASDQPIYDNKNGKNGKKLNARSVDIAWNGERLLVPDVFMEKYRSKFPRLAIPSVIIDAERWLLRHPAKAAGYKSFDAFLNNWLRGEDEKRLSRNAADPDFYEVSEADAALQMQFERDLAAGRIANA